MHNIEEEQNNNKLDLKRIKGYIHNNDEALLIIHAVRLGLFKPAYERPSVEEREAITTGSIFCFIESKTGMKRWTDGKIWSPSKILGHFLLYKEVPRHLSKSALKKEKTPQEYRRKYSYDRNKRMLYVDEEFNLFKKTISLDYCDKTYHVISYFQPFFDRRSISCLPFFQQLQEAINKNHDLLQDKFVEELIEKKIDIHKLYNIPVPKQESFLYVVDREELEKNAINVLSSINNKDPYT